jgi:hypothetical protein
MWIDISRLAETAADGRLDLEGQQVDERAALLAVKVDASHLPGPLPAGAPRPTASNQICFIAVLLNRPSKP